MSDQGTASLSSACTCLSCSQNMVIIFSKLVITLFRFFFFYISSLLFFQSCFFFYPHASCVLECILPMLQICQTSVEWSVIMGCQIMIQDAHRHSPLKCQNMLCSSVLLQAIFRDVKDSSKEPSHQIYELKMIFWNKFEDLTVV